MDNTDMLSQYIISYTALKAVRCDALQEAAHVFTYDDIFTHLPLTLHLQSFASMALMVTARIYPTIPMATIPTRI